MALCFSAQKQRHKCDSNQDTMTETLKYPKKKKKMKVWDIDILVAHGIHKSL